MLPELFIGLLMVIVTILLFFWSSYTRINSYEQGLVIVLGNFRNKIGPGTHFVPPVITNVVKIDMRPSRLTVIVNNVKTIDGNIYDIEANANIQVLDPEKAFFEIQNYKEGTRDLIQMTIQAFTPSLTRKELTWKKREIESKLKNNLNKSVKVWGVRINDLSIESAELLARDKHAAKILNKIDLAEKIRSSISKETEKFGVEIELVEFGKDLVK